MGTRKKLLTRLRESQHSSLPRCLPSRMSKRNPIVLLLDKYSSTSRRKVNSPLFQKTEISSTTESKTPRVFGVPRGSRTDLFRSYGSASLSQADFERQILGVSTATEIS